MKNGSWWRVPSFSVEDMWRVIVIVVILVVHYLGIQGKVDKVQSGVDLIRGDVIRGQRDLTDLKQSQQIFVTAAQLTSSLALLEEVHRRLELKDGAMQRDLDRLSVRIDRLESRRR